MRILSGYVRRRYELITSLEDLSKVIATCEVMTRRKINYSIGSCGWLNEPDAWYVFVYLTDDEAESIKYDLEKKNLVGTKFKKAV